MWRLSGVVLASILVLAMLSGCGGDGDGQEATRDPAEPTVSADDGSTLATTDAARGVSTPAPSIGEIVWATAVQPDTNAAAMVVDRFPADAPVIYGFGPNQGQPWP